MCYEGQDFRDPAAYTCYDVKQRKRVDELTVTCSASSSTPGLLVGVANCNNGHWESESGALCKSASFSVWRLKFSGASSLLSEIQFFAEDQCSNDSQLTSHVLYPSNAKDLVDGDLSNFIFQEQLAIAFDRKISVRCIRGFVDSFLPITVETWSAGKFELAGLLPPGRRTWSMAKLEAIDFTVACPDVRPTWPLRLLGGGRGSGVSRTVSCQPGYREVSPKVPTDGTNDRLNTITCVDGSWTEWPPLKCVSAFDDLKDSIDSAKDSVRNPHKSQSGIIVILYGVAALLTLVVILYLSRKILRLGTNLRRPAQELTELFPVVILEPEIFTSVKSEAVTKAPATSVSPSRRILNAESVEIPRFAFVRPRAPLPGAPSTPPSEPPLSARSNVSVGMMRSSQMSYRR